MRDNGFYLTENFSSDTLVQEFGAVVSMKRQLIKNGSFIQAGHKVRFIYY